jgi:isopentenyl-diphosphate Delta-isomerase
MDEVVVVNESDEVIGTMPKSEANKNGTPHRIAVVYVENSDGEFLVQARTDGYLDHSATGHVDPGESYEEAAKRELAEELDISGTELVRIGHASTAGEKYPGKISSHVFDIFVCRAKPGNLQVNEVKEVYWASPEDVITDMEKDADGTKYCGGFKASLPVYIAYRVTKK